MTLREAVQHLGLSERWIRQLIKQYDLPVVKVPYPGGGRYALTEADVRRLWEVHQHHQRLLAQYHPELYRAAQRQKAHRQQEQDWPAMPPGRAYLDRPQVLGRKPSQGQPGAMVIQWRGKMTVTPVPPETMWNQRRREQLIEELRAVLGPIPEDEEWRRRFRHSLGVALGNRYG